RMSTTAGLGSQEYVAINPLAVTAVVLGLLSVAVLLGWPLLIIPVAAIVLAIVSLRQIHRSNGTQSGKGLAWTGIVLGVAFAALVGTRQITARVAAAEEQRRIEALVAEFNQRITNQQWQALYDLFTPDFQQRWPIGRFHDRLIQVRTSERFGDLQQVTAGPHVHLEDYGDGRRAFGQLRFHFEKADQPVNDNAEYRTVDGEWRLHHLPMIFATDPAAEQG